MCAYNSSRVESADSEMIPPFQLFQPSKAIQIQPIQQRTQFHKQAIAKIAISTVVLQFMGGKASMTRDAAPSYYVFPEDDYEYQ